MHTDGGDGAPASTAELPVGLKDVYIARERLRGVINPTPLQLSRTLGRLAGGETWLKPESLQRTGSFKIRGAYNKIASLSSEERARGVITYSSGNHAQAVACAAGLLGLKAVVVMPEDAVPAKVEATRAYGAEVSFAGLDSLERQARAMELHREFGYTIVPPFDDPAIIAGQGTCGLEILEELPNVQVILVPCGGGGLLSGVALAAKSIRPEIVIIGVEPEGADDARASLAAGQITEIESKTVCDGLRTKRIGNLNFQVLRRTVDRMITVADEETLEAMRFLALRAKLVVEPSGAVAVAALLTGKVPIAGRRAVAVISGGNVEPARLAAVMGAPTAATTAAE
ncbi:MAG: pyridoxal-phosphate dependent enzyme [Chloroflexi bacterium]|nr:pyridoxal-phosphate dependent enzyme [Chloroflexota bacterium]